MVPSTASDVRTTLSTNLCRVRRSFKPYQNEHDSVKETGEKGKNHVTLTRKFPQKSCFTTHLPFLSPNPKILKAFPKTFPTKMKLTKCPAKAKNEARKAEEEERRGEKRKSREILLSGHARTLQTNILHLDQKTSKFTICKQFCGSF